MNRSSWDSAGRWAWGFVGMAAAAAIVYFVLAQLTGLVVPLVIAAVVGVLFVPLVDRLGRLVPRPVASGIVLIGLVAVGYWTVAIMTAGVVEYAPEIREALADGLDAIVEWIAELGWSVGEGSDLFLDLEQLVESLVPGIASWVGGAFSSVAAFLVGTFVSLFFLYFILADWQVIKGWIAGHLGVAPDVGEGMIGDSVWSLRTYFYVLSGTALLTAVLIGAAMAVLGLPLASTVAIVTFVTSYVPYLGAFVSGAFAFLIALGVGGPGDAVVVLIVVLVVQNIVQPLIQTKFTEGALKIHAIVVFGSTLVGAALAGVLGAMLSAPIVAMLISITKRLRDADQEIPPD